MSIARKMKRAAVKPPMSVLSVDVGRRLQLKSKPVNRKGLDLHDKMLIKSTLARSVDYWMTCTLTDLTHFVGCNFDEDRYEKLFGKDSKIPIPQAEEQLKQHLPVSLPEGMRKKLIDAANNHNLTLNQYILKVLKDGLTKEGK